MSAPRVLESEGRFDHETGTVRPKASKSARAVACLLLLAACGWGGPGLAQNPRDKHPGTSTPGTRTQGNLGLRQYAQDLGSAPRGLRANLKFGDLPAASSDIRFGMVAAMSGPSKELGMQMKVGVESAFDAANDAGGVNGQAVRLEALDDGYDPTRTLEQVKRLREKNNVIGLIGDVGTPTAAVALPYTLENKMLFFGAFSGANLLRRDPPDRYVLNYRASYAEETQAAVNYLVKVRRLKPEQIVVFAQKDFLRGFRLRGR